jgi:hypothetical protein
MVRVKGARRSRSRRRPIARRIAAFLLLQWSNLYGETRKHPWLKKGVVLLVVLATLWFAKPALESSIARPLAAAHIAIAHNAFAVRASLAFALALGSYLATLLLGVLIDIGYYLEPSVANVALGFRELSLNSDRSIHLLQELVRESLLTDETVRVICIRGHSLFARAEPGQPEPPLAPLMAAGRLDILMPLSDPGNASITELSRQRPQEYGTPEEFARTIENLKQRLWRQGNSVSEHDLAFMWRIVLFKKRCFVQRYSNDTPNIWDSPAFVYRIVPDDADYKRSGHQEFFESQFAMLKARADQLAPERRRFSGAPPAAPPQSRRTVVASSGDGLLCLHDAPEADGRPALVLVHGLGGDRISTWGATQGQSNDWPAWLAEDTGCPVWTLGYDAAPSAWTADAMPLTSQGVAVLDLLYSEAGLRDRDLVLIGHSMGGLVIKTAIVHAITFPANRYRDLAKRVRAVCFLATPHNGSHLATLATAVRSILRLNVQVKDLTANPHLTELNHQFQKAHTELGFAVRTYSEQKHLLLGKKYFGIVFGKRIMVVDPNSAEPHVHGEVAIPVPEDHFSIAKPASKHARIHKSMLKFIKELDRNAEGDPGRSPEQAGVESAEQRSGGRGRSR